MEIDSTIFCLITTRPAHAQIDPGLKLAWTDYRWLIYGNNILHLQSEPREGVEQNDRIVPKSQLWFRAAK